MLSTPLPMVLSIRGSGKISIDMATVFKCGQMVRAMKAAGKIIKLTGMVCSTMSMAIYSKDLGSTIRPTALELTSMLMAASIKVSGWTTFKKVKVVRHGLIRALTRACIIRDKKMAKALTLGLMAQYTTASG